MASSYQTSGVGDNTTDYSDLVGFWKETWFRAWLVFEIVLFAGGYLMASMGTQRDTAALAGQAPDVHLALGGVMGTLGLVFGICFLIAIAGSVYLRMQALMESDVTF